MNLVNSMGYSLNAGDGALINIIMAVELRRLVDQSISHQVFLFLEVFWPIRENRNKS